MWPGDSHRVRTAHPRGNIHDHRFGAGEGRGSHRTSLSPVRRRGWRRLAPGRTTALAIRLAGPARRFPTARDRLAEPTGRAGSGCRRTAGRPAQSGRCRPRRHGHLTTFGANPPEEKSRHKRRTNRSAHGRFTEPGKRIRRPPHRPQRTAPAFLRRQPPKPAPPTALLATPTAPATKRVQQPAPRKNDRPADLPEMRNPPTRGSAAGTGIRRAEPPSIKP